VKTHSQLATPNSLLVTAYPNNGPESAGTGIREEVPDGEPR
jgi:hypothetical protein